MKKVTLLLPLLLLIFLAGCAVNSSNNPGLFAKERTYNMVIIKSTANTSSTSYESKDQQIMPTDLLERSGITYEKNGDRITKLDGVVATASKQWNLYVNNQKNDLSTAIQGDNKIEWRYEAK